MSEEQKKLRSPEGMGGLAKGLMLIEAFCKRKQAMSLSELASETNISRASARRCLLTLIELGYIRRVGTHYSPTPRMLRLGAAYFEMSTIPQLAQPHLDQARDDLDESVSLGLIEGPFAMIVARSEVNRPVATFARLGAALPIYASAIGRVLIAQRGDDEIDSYLATAELTKYTSKTVIDKKELKAIFADVRAQGHAVSSEQFEMGIFAIATPICDRDGAAIAAISLSTSLAKLSIEEAMERYLPVIRRQAEAISRTL